MSEQWSRAHDRTLAEKCLGVDVLADEELRLAMGNLRPGHCDGLTAYRDDTSFLGWADVPHYNTDIAACFRAAEAWRRQEAGRHYRIYSACDSPQRTWIQSATLVDHGMTTAGTGEGPFALAWALYEAVSNER